MKVLNVNFALLLLLIAGKTVFAGDASGEDHSPEEDVFDGSKLEDLCGGSGSHELSLGKEKDSVKYFTMGEDKEELEDCEIKIEAPSSQYGIVVVMEKYNTKQNKGFAVNQEESEGCTSSLKITFKTDGQNQDSSMCFKSNGGSNTRSYLESGEYVDIEYIVWSTSEDTMTLLASNSGDEMFGMVITAVRKDDDCQAEEFQCVTEGVNGGKPHCIWGKFQCDSHVNCAVVPTPTDELACDNHNATFYGVAGPVSYYWTESLLLVGLIVIPIVALILVGLVIIFICIRKMIRKRHLRSVAREAGHVNVISVPEYEKDEKQNNPPDYSSIEELPPAYHSLFLPTTNLMQNNDPKEIQMNLSTVPEEKEVVFSDEKDEKDEKSLKPQQNQV